MTHRQIGLVMGAAIAVLTLCVGVYGLVTGPSHRTNHHHAEPASAHSAPPRPTPVTAADQTPQPLPQTTDPITYARAVATSLFNWNTASGLLPTDYTAMVLADADPSGDETPGLLDDVATYLPTTDQWVELGAMDVAQTIEIAGASLPASWPTALAQARGQLRPGTAAVTITGARHRTGVWNGQPAASSYPVSFTVFVACPPAFDRCHVLRLSQLDKPLK